jgi:hypothetical protein
MFFLRVDGTSRTPALPYRPTELIIVKFFCAERADGHCSLSFSCRSERACGALCLASIRSSAESRRLSMANSDQKARDTLAADETDELISSEKVEGTAVYDRKGEKIGSVHHLMINKYTGQVAYAVIFVRRVSRHRRRVSPDPVAAARLRRTGRRLCRRYRPGATREGAALRREPRTGLGGSRLHRAYR